MKKNNTLNRFIVICLIISILINLYFYLCPVSDIVISDAITVILTIINLIYVILLYNLEKKDKNSKLIINTSKVHNYGFKSIAIFGSYLKNLDYNKVGFPNVTHDYLDWNIIIKNIGEYPATNIEISISLLVKKVQFPPNHDKLLNTNEANIVDYETITESVTIDYIAPGIEKKILVANLNGRLIGCDLYVNKLTSCEGTYIKSMVKIDSYEHLSLEMIEDSSHLRDIYGWK